MSGFNKPAFFDLDLDGAMDLVIGSDVGALVFYRNVGGGTQCALHANAEQWDSQSSGTPVGSTYTTPDVRAVLASVLQAASPASCVC